MHEDFRLTLQFRSLAEFAVFVALVRGETLDDEKLREMTARLRKATDAEAAAVQAATSKEHP